MKVCLCYKDMNSCHLCWYHASLSNNSLCVPEVPQMEDIIHYYNCTVWRQHHRRVWNKANINPHAKLKLLSSASILVVSVTTMLIPLNMINHIRKHTDKRRKLLLKLINDPSWTSQNTTDDVHSNRTKKALPPLGAPFFSCHCTPVSSSPPLLAEFFSVHRHQAGCPSHRVKHGGIETSAGGPKPAQLNLTAVF